MASVQGIKSTITNGFNTIKTKAGKAYKNLGLGTILAGEYIKGLAKDTVSFAKANPRKASVIAFVAAAGIGAATKLLHLGVSKFKEQKEEKQIEEAINKRNAVIATMAEPAIKEAAQVIDAQAAEIERLEELVKTHELVHEADQESINAYRDVVSADKTEQTAAVEEN